MISNIKHTIFLICLISFKLSFCQINNNEEILSSPEGLFDKVVDSYGNTFNLTEIIAGKTYLDKNSVPSTNVLLCTSGIFALYFESGCGMEIVGNLLHDKRRAIVCQAFQDYSDFINTPLKNIGNTNKVRIWIRNFNNISPSMQLSGSSASAGFYNLPINITNSTSTGAGTGVNTNIRGGIADNEVWKTINTGVNSYQNTALPITSNSFGMDFYHGLISLNFTQVPNWNYDFSKYNVATGFINGDFDVYGTVAHEITHILGFNSLMYYTGSSQTENQPYGFYWYTFNRFYSRFDKFLKTSLGTNLISNNVSVDGEMYNYDFTTSSSNLTPNCSLNPPFLTSNIANGTNCLTAIKFNGTVTIPVYTPGCFENGFSLQHLEDSCFNNNLNDQYFLMSDRKSDLFAKRFLSVEERQVMCDLGYSLKGSFGNINNFTYKYYGTDSCPGITVAGVNDGFTSSNGYIYQGNSGDDITISGILNNDYTSGQVANLRFEYVQDMYDITAVITNPSSSSTSFVFKTLRPGLHLLRYVPYDITNGKRGNITYIFVNVLNNCSISNYCNLVRNGNFEEHFQPPNRLAQIYKSCGWQNVSYNSTSDYFNTDSTFSRTGVPCNTAGYQKDKIAGNGGYAGMIIREQPSIDFLENVYTEPIKTELINKLLPNTAYKLTFDVSRAEYSSFSTKFQMFLTDTNISYLGGGVIPDNYINSNTILLYSNNFANAITPDGWETITFNFTTNSNPNLKYLYIGALKNISFQLESQFALPAGNNCPNIFSSSQCYYYIDNVSLTAVVGSNYLTATNDDFTTMPINSINGGITASVFSNDLINNQTSNLNNINYVNFSLTGPISISGATINNMGLINVPPNTPSGNYTLYYNLQLNGNCTVVSTGIVLIAITNNLVTPNISSSIRANNLVEIIKLQSNNKIIISGTFTTYNNFPINRFCRLNSDLTLDQTFLSTGATALGTRAKDIAIQTDNKIIVVGGFNSFSGSGTSTGVCRLLADGSVDSAFNLGGLGLGRFNKTTLNIAYCCAIQSDGKILVGGDFYYYNGIKRLGIVRLLTNGAIDLTFDPIEINDNYRTVVTKILIQNDGKILLEGFFSYSDFPVMNLIRLNLNGSIDSSFIKGNTVGSVLFQDISSGLLGPLSNMILQNDNKIIVTGAFTKYNNNNVNNILRLMPDGSIDPTFNTLNGTDRAIYDVIIEKNSNKIIVAGEFTTFNTAPVKRMLRLNTSGNLDPSFNIGAGTSSTLSTAPPYNAHNIRCLTLQPDNKIIVGGRFTAFNTITAGNITRIYGDSGFQARGIDGFKFQSEPEINTNFDNNIVIYPNPSSDVFNIDLRSSAIKYYKLSLYDILGKKINEKVLFDNDLFQVDLSNFSSGCYVIRLESDTNSQMFKLFKK